MTAQRKTGRRKTQGVRIRMYNVGFGDAFLIFIPSTEGTKKILVDCGSIKSGGRAMSDVVEGIIEDVKDDAGNPSIDVVVCTHRHKDHVSGFARAGWKNVGVKEVWMPWTEDPSDRRARRIRNAQSRLARQLDSALGAAIARVGANSTQRQTMESLRDLAVNALSNEAAMATLHRGFSGRPRRRYLNVKRTGGVPLDLTDGGRRSEVLPGVEVFVLGPSRDEDVIRDLDPPTGKHYLRLFEGENEKVTRAPDPFDTEWRVARSAHPRRFRHLKVLSKDLERIDGMGSFEAGVAVALDKAVNGTSLMLVLKIGSVHLLLPGDAEWGTWKLALETPEHRDLLERTAFYKVGHHGSYNATPKEFIEKTVGRNFRAMVSTHTMKQWKHIPKKELLTAMAKKTKRIARSDKDSRAPRRTFRVERGSWIETEIPIR